VILLVRGLRPIGGQENPLDYWFDMNGELIRRLTWARVIAIDNSTFDGTGTISASGSRLKGVVEGYANGGSIDVYIVAHSMGGLVTRSCLSQMGSHRSWVKKIVMLSTPNCGSHVADFVVETARIASWAVAGNPNAGLEFGMMLDPGRCNAVLDLQTDRVIGYARQWNDSGSNYYVFGGTSNSGAVYKAGSAVLAYWPVGTDNQNDGMVTKLSAWAATGPDRCCLGGSRPLCLLRCLIHELSTTRR